MFDWRTSAGVGVVFVYMLFGLGCASTTTKSVSLTDSAEDAVHIVVIRGTSFKGSGALSRIFDTASVYDGDKTVEPSNLCWLSYSSRRHVKSILLAKYGRNIQGLLSGGLKEEYTLLTFSESVFSELSKRHSGDSSTGIYKEWRTPGFSHFGELIEYFMGIKHENGFVVMSDDQYRRFEYRKNKRPFPPGPGVVSRR